MGTIRVQQTDNAQEAIDSATVTSNDAPGEAEPDVIADFVGDNADDIIGLAAAVQRLEGLVERIIDRMDGGRLSV